MVKKSTYKQTKIGDGSTSLTTIIPEGWERKRIGDCIELIYGVGLPKRERIKGEIPVFGSNGVVGFHNKALVKGPAIIIGRKGSVGEVVLSQNDFWPIDTTYYVKTKKDQNAHFWFYFLTTLGLKEMNSHSAVPGLNRDNVYEIIKMIPSCNEQRAIAKILSDLDEKIELNRQINKTLEAIAQAIFKQWFVDFEFPGHEKVKFVNGLPEGWRRGNFGDLARIQPGFAFKSNDFISNGYRVIKIANIQNGIVDFVKCDHVPDEIFKNVDKKFYLTSGDVIVAMTGAEIGKIGIIPKTDAAMLLNQRVGKLVSDYFLWAYYTLKGDEIQSLIDGISSASSAQSNISNNDIEKTEVIIPDGQTLKYFCQTGEPLFNQLVSNLGENIMLSQIRDSLLPRLMSGKIRVN